MRDTKENMEKRVVSLASSGVIGYYIFSKLNAAQDTAEVPEDGLNLPPALKEATFYEGGIVSVESVKRMSEIIAEQARVYAATIRNGIRTPIVVENEQPEVAEEENIREDYIDEPIVEDESSVENDIVIDDAQEDSDSVDDSMFDTPVIEDLVIDEPVIEEEFENTEDTDDDSDDMFTDDAQDEELDEVVDEGVEETVEESADAEVQTVYVPVAVAEEIPENAEVVAAPVAAPVAFTDMGGFENFEAATLPVAPVLSEDATLQMPVSGAGLSDLALPSLENVQFAEPAAEEETIVEETPLMENVEPLHKVEEEEEDPRNKEQFKSIADFLNTL